MLLPTNTGGDGTLALLPFFSEELDWDSLGMDKAGWEDSPQDKRSGGQSGSGGIPYAPSHLLPLSTLSSGSSLSAAGAARSSTLGSSSHTGANAFLPGMSSPPIRNIVSMTFLPGFTEPTLALLYAPDWTWSGRLEHLAHNYLVSLVTLSSTNAAAPSGLSASPTRAVIIATSPPLPYSCLSLTACPATLGGVLLTTANGILHLDQSGRVVAAPTTAWLARDYPPGRARPVGLDDEHGKRSGELGEELEGSRVEFISHPGDDESDANAEQEPTALVWAPSGAILELSFARTGRTIAGMTIRKAADGSGLTGGAASVVTRIGGAGSGKSGLVFVGSEQGEAGLCRWSLGGGTAASTVLEVAKEEEDDKMGLDDDEEGTSFPFPFFSRPSLTHALHRYLQHLLPSRYLEKLDPFERGRSLFRSWR
jgi:cleavage and polyadenylation specificity factor subunit 1